MHTRDPEAGRPGQGLLQVASSSELACLCLALCVSTLPPPHRALCTLRSMAWLLSTFPSHAAMHTHTFNNDPTEGHILKSPLC